jgi:hypothetical protein
LLLQLIATIVGPGAVAKEYLLLDYLPDRPESCIEGAIGALDTTDPLVKQTISSIEAPSAVAVVRELFPGVIVEFASIPEPDPRVPVRPVSTVLWHYDGFTAQPAVDSPRQSVAESISRIARSKYNLRDWSELAALEASRLREPAGMALALMVHPPACEPPIPLWDWRFRAQVAAALVATRLTEQAAQDPVGLLSEIIDGPVDWTCTAALVALLDVARRRRKYRDEIVALFLDVLKRPSSPVWFTNCAYPAAVACRRVPGLSKGLYAKLDRLIDAWSS